MIEIATGEELGTFDSVADIALCLAFAKLGRDQVEIVTDASPHEPRSRVLGVTAGRAWRALPRCAAGPPSAAVHTYRRAGARRSG